MKVEIDDITLANLNYFKNSILMIGNSLIVIKSFNVETEDKIIKHFFSKPTVQIKRYVTDIKIISYNLQNKYFIRVGDDDCERILLFTDLSNLRRNWTTIYDQLKGFGFDIKTIDKDEKSDNQS